MTNISFVDNILRVLDMASPAIVEDGISWYPRAHRFALSFGDDVTRAAAIIAVLSPNTSWTANMTFAKKAYAQGNGMGMGFPDKVQKVNRLFMGENPFDVVSGPKVTAFFNRILNPECDTTVPVIDRHAQDIADGFRNNERKAPKGKAYDEYANAYITAAKLSGFTSHALQAITWTQWREMHNINV